MKKFSSLMGLITTIALAGCIDAPDGAGDTAEPAVDPAAETPRVPAASAPLPSGAELARMNDFVARRADPSIVRLTLATKAGRRVDCIDINRQPALHGAPLEAPPHVIDAPTQSATERRALIAPAPLYTLDTQVVARCPTGTVPRPEVTMADLRRFATLDEYFAKDPSGARGASGPAMPTPGSLELSPAPSEDDLDAPHVGPTTKHQYAHAARSVTNWGAETRMSIASFATEIDKEFSLGQIWVSGGSGDGLQTLEVGIQRYHQLYGDDKQHLFIYSTRANYRDGTGCYNNSCDDFVQTSSTWIPGEEVGPVSVVGGAQHSLYIHWTKAGDSGAWWLSVNGELVGYYPRNLYTAVKDHAARIDFGGEITDYQTDGRHTKTNMGTGRPASAGWQQAAYMRLLRYHDSNPSGNAVTWHEASGLTPSQSDAACYSIDLNNASNDADWKNYFWYGGGGYANPACL
jgi:hypothetical protein